MNILHLSPYFPSINATHAGGVCMGREIEELSKKHNVYVLCFGSYAQNDEKLRNGLNAIKVDCIKLSTRERMFNVIRHPLSASMFATRKSKAFKRKIEQYIREYRIEAVHAEFAAMGQYIDFIKKINPNIKCNLILHDVTYQSYVRQEAAEHNLVKKIFISWQKQRVKNDENRYVRSADNVMTFSPKDVELINQIYGIKAVWINTYFDVEDALKRGQKRLDNHIKSNAICFFGQMGRAENHLAAMKLVKIVNSLSDIKTYIVGTKPEQELKNCSNDRIIVTGFVEDPDDILEKCDIAVFPLTVGAGIKIKVLHCMALGLPVITTVIGAEGIDDNGEIIDLVETDDEFIEMIKNRMADDDWLRKSSIKGMEHIKSHFTWDRTIQVFNRIYK